MATATATKKKIKFRPTDDRVLVEPCEAEDKTAGGIILPDTAREKPQRGRVVATGPGKLLDSGGPESIAGSNDYFFTVLIECICKFSYACRFTGTIDSSDKNKSRALSGHL